LRDGIAAARAPVAADNYGRVYWIEGDDGHLAMLENGTLSTYLTAEELSVAVGASAMNPLPAIGVDSSEDGSLYVLTPTHILVSRCAHQATVHGQNPGLDLFGVGRTNQIAGIAGDGVRILMIAGSTLLYPTSVLHETGSCALLDYAQSDVAFVFQPGCNGNGVVRGNLDGSGTEYVFNFKTILPGGEFSNSLCTARAPDGGFYALLQLTTSTQLYHYAPDFGGTHGLQTILTTPTFDDAAPSGAFFYCRMAATRDGRNLFIIAGGKLWQVML
jgi:hypothetical protein